MVCWLSCANTVQKRRYGAAVALRPSEEQNDRGSRSSSVFCSFALMYDAGVVEIVHNCTVFEINGLLFPIRE
jgi:hypothetical protein